ncbi:hypothetical protein EYF80_024090 [Liparis tanakae]|uniref:Uncharacterized protein n=1 Tax=Liparis tanakae TaxID=230148 RepID=A0A4Z2HIQ2_9TELE|nr:hypothetical protein EYF80_024090 [Liparis tanakae]
MESHRKCCDSDASSMQRCYSVSNDLERYDSSPHYVVVAHFLRLVLFHQLAHFKFDRLAVSIKAVWLELSRLRQETAVQQSINKVALEEGNTIWCLVESGRSNAVQNMSLGSTLRQHSRPPFGCRVGAD